MTCRIKFSDSVCALNLKSLTTLLIYLLGPLVLTGCGGASGSGTQAPPTITSVTVVPATAQVATGSSQLFTAQVRGTGPFNTSVTWSVNGINGGDSVNGTIVGGQYTAPAVPPEPSAVMIAATSVQDPTKWGSSTAAIYIPARLTSITPDDASAWEQVTLNGENLVGLTQVVFSGPNGTILTAAFQQISLTQLTAVVPSGTVSGPVYLTLTPYEGVPYNTNSVPFTRLPNLLLNAPTKDLSSGESMQFNWRLLGADSPNQISWTTDIGSISSSGLFQAPAVNSESYATVTACVQDTTSCNTVLLRILPFRIVPTTPVVSLGQTIQIDAIQGGSVQTAKWSVLAGGGSITSGGSYTAPTSTAEAGPIPISATVGKQTEQASIAVTGAFPGMVNRVYDYVDYNNTGSTQTEGSFVEAVAVNGNRAYSLSLGAIFQNPSAYAAINVYDVTNPDQPVWLDAVESVRDSGVQEMFVYGGNLIELTTDRIDVYSLQGQAPSLTSVFSYPTTFHQTVNNGIVYALPTFSVTTEIPVDLYDVSSGAVAHRHYDLPTPPDNEPAFVYSISGTGNTVYISWLNASGSSSEFTVAAYDISQSPPTLVASVGSDGGFEIQVANQSLFADQEAFDISHITPQHVATLPVEYVWSVQGNLALATGTSGVNITAANYVVIDVTHPANPVVTANVADLPSWDIFNFSNATWASGGRFYSTDGTGGFTIYNVASPGGPSTITFAGFLDPIYDQVIQQTTLYQAGNRPDGSGGLATFDISGSTPNLLGNLVYAKDPAFAVQVSGTNVFLGLADSLKVVDVSNPTNPVEIASVAVPTNAVVLSGTTLFDGSSNGHLVVLDVSNPTAPQIIATVAMTPPQTMRLDGSLLYVAAGAQGMLIFDVSNPAAPVMVSKFAAGLSGSILDVSPQGSIAVLAASGEGLLTVDVSNPAKPVQLAQQTLPPLNAFPAPGTDSGAESAISLAFQNGITYLGSSDGIEFAYDVSIPTYPRLITFNVVGADDNSPVSVITPAQNNLYIATNGPEPTLFQLENSSPRNSIELYYPPAALSKGNPTRGVARGGSAATKSGSKLLSSCRAVNHRRADRFGIARGGRNRNRLRNFLPEFSGSNGQLNLDCRQN